MKNVTISCWKASVVGSERVQGLPFNAAHAAPKWIAIKTAAPADRRSAARESAAGCRRQQAAAEEREARIILITR
ncbi:MAG: hypothetical protein U1E76_02295 [Planctomycetota bacterium]